MLLVCSILGRFLLPYWDVSFVHLNTPPCLAYGVVHCIGKTKRTWIYGLLFLLKVYSESSLHNLWGCSGTSHPFHYPGCAAQWIPSLEERGLLFPIDWWTIFTSSRINPYLMSSQVFQGNNWVAGSAGEVKGSVEYYFQSPHHLVWHLKRERM